MGDTLSASSLLLAALALVYSQWYPQITATLRKGENAKNKNSLDRKPELREVRNALHGRALPLLISASFLFFVLLPDAVRITASSARSYAEEGFRHLRNYDTVLTAYVLTVLILFGFCIHLVLVAVKAYKLKRALSADT